MPRLVSASVEDFHTSANFSLPVLSQHYSDDFLLLSKKAQATRGPRRSRTDYSEQTFNGGLPSPPLSECDEARPLTPEPISKHYRFAHGFPQTPGSDNETSKSIDSFPFESTPNPEFHTHSTVVAISNPRTPLRATKHVKRLDAFPFPLDPLPTYVKSTSGKIDPRIRCVSTGAKFLTPPASPDRYISSRYSPQPASSTFHTSKSPHQLSGTERLLRQDSASPDPFGSPTPSRGGRRVVSGDDSRRETQATSHPTRGTNVLGPQSTPTVQNRQASAGAVWNVGGNTAASPTGPVQGIPNGSGGLIASGTNAPMYTSRFLEGETADQDLERLEGRLAAALDIDRTIRMLDIPGSPNRPRHIPTNTTTSKRKYPFIDSRTQWKNGAWVQESTKLCELPFVCLSIKGFTKIYLYSSKNPTRIPQLSLDIR